MSTYAQVSDYQAYTELATQTASGGLQQLLDDAENDIDKILPRTRYLTSSVQGITLTGATGGQFKLQESWRGIFYTTPNINWNAQGADLLNALQAATDQYGNALPSAVWEQPEAQYYQQNWAFGPFPSVPIVVQAVNSMGRQKLPNMSVVFNGLTGTNPTVTVTSLIGGGLRFNPYQIPADYADSLKRAVCAQAEYRDQMGPGFFARAQWRNVSGPEFKTAGKLPRIGPKVWWELQGTDLVQRGARARPGTAMGRQAVYSPVGGIPIPDDWRSV